MSEWQPIDDLPEDEPKFVDLWVGGERVPNCYFREGVGWYFVSPSEGGENGFPLDSFYSEDAITHWMPIPAPPTA